MNGFWDFIISFVLTLGTILARINTLTETENIVWVILPIVFPVICMNVFNYMIGYEQRNLFLLEKNTKKM